MEGATREGSMRATAVKKRRRAESSREKARREGVAAKLVSELQGGSEKEVHEARREGDDEDTEEAAIVSKIKEEQRLRELSRRHASGRVIAPVAVSRNSAAPTTAWAETAGIAEQPRPLAGAEGALELRGEPGKVLAELQQHFAAERDANQHLDAQLERYIAARLRERHGSAPRSGSSSADFLALHETSTAADQPSVSALAQLAREEAELYAVPAHLQLPKRAPYDPSEALPAGGVEEVRLQSTASFARSRSHSSIARLPQHRHRQSHSPARTHLASSSTQRPDDAHKQ